MDLQNILGTGAVVAIVTAVVNWFFYSKNKNTDFGYNYKKYILEKRTKTYEQVETLLNFDIFSLKPFGDQSSNDKVEYQNNLTDFQIKLQNVYLQNFWLGKKISKEIMDLRETVKHLLAITKDMKVENGKVLFQHLQFVKYFNNIHGSYLSDIVSLNEIDLFYTQMVIRAEEHEQLGGTIEGIEKSYNEQQSELEQLNAEYERLVKENQELKEQKNILQKQNDELEK